MQEDDTRKAGGGGGAAPPSLRGLGARLGGGGAPPPSLNESERQMENSLDFGRFENYVGWFNPRFDCYDHPSNSHRPCHKLRFGRLLPSKSS